MKIKWSYVILGIGVVAFTGGFIYRHQIKRGLKDVINYAFTKEQEYYLSELHSKYIDVFKKFISEGESKTGYKVLITSGFRTFPEQIKLHAENPQNASVGKSMHNYGLAIDINLISKLDGHIIRKADSTKTWEDTGIVKIAKKYGLKWGGGGSFGTYADNVHFEIPLGGANLYAQAIKQFGSESKVIGNKIQIT